VKQTFRKRCLVGLCLALVAVTWSVRAQPRIAIALSAPEIVGDGIALYRSTDASVLDPSAPAGAVALVAVELDPKRIRLATALAHGCSPARATVVEIAAREEAVVALNAGFFLPRGAPAGLLKRSGRWIGGASRARGVAILPAPGPDGAARVLFTRATLGADLQFRSRLKTRVVPIDHLTPQDAATGLSYFVAPCPELRQDEAAGAPAAPDAREQVQSPATPATPTTTWPLGRGYRVVTVSKRSQSAGPSIESPYGRLEFRGAVVPRDLARLGPGTRVTIVPRIVSPEAAVLRDAPDAVGGAGLLISGGAPVADWSGERLSPTFATDRHPRSVIGVDGEGDIWLITVDGRRPSHSVGMSFVELQRLGQALGLRDALNLDGGGSTTLVVRGQIVNRPSDLTGPRPVSDAIVVRAR
jgi:hypothetical protein